MSTRTRNASRRSATSVSSRRSFVWTMGAGVSAALVPAATVSAAGTEAVRVDDPALRLLLLEEEQAVRRLHQAFEEALDRQQYDEVIAMFAEDAAVTFNGGVFRHRARGVTRLYRDLFASGRSGGRTTPAPGFELAADQQREEVQVALDRLSATATFPYSIQVGTPFESENSLASMARLHGEGVRTWWEGGAYHVTYRKAVADGPWTISRLGYRTLSRADYRPGRTYAAPIAVARLTVRYPADRLGPDELIEQQG